MNLRNLIVAGLLGLSTFLLGCDQTADNSAYTAPPDNTVVAERDDTTEASAYHYPEAGQTDIKDRTITEPANSLDDDQQARLEDRGPRDALSAQTSLTAQRDEFLDRLQARAEAMEDRTDLTEAEQKWLDSVHQRIDLVAKLSDQLTSELDEFDEVVSERIEEDRATANR
ncbi:MAG: hypothetical protein AB7S38_19220 [Vulcanimicrobiota bacterium]